MSIKSLQWAVISAIAAGCGTADEQSVDAPITQEELQQNSQGLSATLPVSAWYHCMGDQTMRDTGIDIVAGQYVRFATNSDNTWNNGAGFITNADGTPGMTKTDPVSGLTFTAHGLVGKIGNGRYFWIGANRSIQSLWTGRLYLLDWDTPCADNSDNILVNIIY